MENQPEIEEDPIRNYVLDKKLSFWEKILRWVYSKQEWDAYLLEKIEKYRAKGKTLFL